MSPNGPKRTQWHLLNPRGTIMNPNLPKTDYIWPNCPYMFTYGFWMPQISLRKTFMVVMFPMFTQKLCIIRRIFLRATQFSLVYCKGKKFLFYKDILSLHNQKKIDWETQFSLSLYFRLSFVSFFFLLSV